MAYSVTQSAYTPSARTDDAGTWTHVRWEQAESRRGPWTQLDTQTVNFGTDPGDPDTVELTTEQATLYPAWYRLVALDAQDTEEPTDPFYAGSAIRPTVQEVADRMPDRTTTDGGAEARTFTTLTTPTAEEVERAIDDALDIVDPKIPEGATAEVERAARKAVVLHAAIQIETGNWSDQYETNTERVALWERLLATHIQTLEDAAQDNTPGHARFGSVTITSPTLSAQAALGWCTDELIP